MKTILPVLAVLLLNSPLVAATSAPATAPAKRPVLHTIVDITFGEGKPDPLPGTEPAYWTPGNFSPGDGTYRWFDEDFARKHALATGNRWMVLDVEGFQDAARSAGVLKLLESLHRHAPGRKIIIAGFDLGQPEGAHPFNGWTWPMHLRMHNAALSPVPADRRVSMFGLDDAGSAFRAFLLDRTLAQREIVRRCGVVSLGMYVCQVDQEWEEQKLCFKRWAAFMKERYPGVDRAAWVANFQVFRSRSAERLAMIPEKELAEYAQIIRDNVEIAILFGYWDDTEPLYRALIEAKRRD